MKKDAEALYEYLKSPVTPCFYNERLNSLSEAEHEVLRRTRDQSQFAVCMRDNDVLIGHLFADNSNEPDNDTWVVGWHFNQRYEKKVTQPSRLQHCLIIYLTKREQGVCTPGWKIIIFPPGSYVSVSI